MSGTIVVGVDGSEPSLKALRWAVRQAKLTGDDVGAVIGWEYPATGWAGMLPGMPPEFEPEQLAWQILDEALDKTLEADVAAVVERRVVSGPAAQVLLDASEGASSWSSATVGTAASRRPCSARSACMSRSTRSARWSWCGARSPSTD